MDRFHRLYYENPARTWQNTTWLGVPAEKCPLDLWLYQELIARIRPELIVETGTANGGSALFLASCMDLIDRGRVITVDIEHRENRPQHARISYLLGSSLDEDVIVRIRAEAESASPVIVILDSDHSRDHVLAELNLYAHLVTPGSYVIVEDTNLNGRPILPGFGPGPHEAIGEFLRTDRRFSRDEACEKFLLSFNPGGFLRRVDD